MEAKKEITIREYIDQQIEFHKEQINRHIGAIEGFTKMKDDIVRSNSEQEEKAEPAPSADNAGE